MSSGSNGRSRAATTTSSCATASAAFSFARSALATLRRMQRTRFIWAGVACLVACAVLFLSLGMYLGGHPSDLPTRLQKIFVAKDDRVRAQLIKQIQESYYKKVPKSQLEQASLNGIVQSLHDRFS